jgi:energy-coupling factor transport system ATP-binding protein
VRRIDVQLGGRTVLSLDELDLHAGECVGLMGRNGAGKSTLLRSLAGLVKPACGAIEGLTAVEPARRYREIAFVPQDPASTLYKPTLEMEISDVLHGTGREGTVDAALAEWDIERFRHADPRDVSVGERQRAALAALTVGHPRLILLDEPTRGMDAATKELLIRNLKRRCNEGACVVLASHDVELIAGCAGRIVLLAEGEIVADGPSSTVLTGSITFSTQANKLLGGDVLTVEDAVARLRRGEQ